MRIPKEHLELLSKGAVCIADGEKITDGKHTGLEAIVVGVKQKRPRSQVSSFEMIPKKIAHQTTDVIEVGIVNAQYITADELMGGLSVGHYAITAGTLGIICDGVIISNNHVLANSNEGLLGDAILHPGQADIHSDKERKAIAKLVRYIPIIFEGNTQAKKCGIASIILSVLNGIAGRINSSIRFSVKSFSKNINEVDFAMARILPDIKYKDKEIMAIGNIKGIKHPYLGMKIQKSGRTTNTTQGKVIGLNATVKVNYGNKRAIFGGQIMTTSMSKPGDSGSIGVDIMGFGVGLLFAGSEYVTFYNPLRKVFELGGISYEKASFSTSCSGAIRDKSICRE